MSANEDPGPHAPLLSVVCLSVALVPAAATGALPATWGWPFLVVGVVALAVPKVARPALAAAVPTAVYLGFAGLPVTAVRLGALVLALVGLLLVRIKTRGWTSLVVVLAAALPITLAAAVLIRSGWRAEAVRALGLLSGLAAGASVALAGLSMWSLPEETARRRFWRPTAIALILAGGIRLLSGPPQAAVGPEALPAWRHLAGLLAPYGKEHMAGAERFKILTALDELRTAGVSDAGYAWASLALEENADPGLLRLRCPQRPSRGVLSASWRPLVALGVQACGIANAPEEGIQTLTALLAEPAPDAKKSPHEAPDGHDRRILYRLLADLWAEQGNVKEAIEAYRKAAAGGDPFAERNAVRLQIDRSLSPHRLIEHRPLDPLVQIWLDPTASSPSLWKAWNAAMDFSGLQPVRRFGMHPIQAPGALRITYARELGRRVITTLTRHRLAFRVTLPSLPGRAVPAEMAMRFRSHHGFRISFEKEDGTMLTYACDALGPHEDQQIIRLDSPGCAGHWAEARVHPSALLTSPVSEAYLQGEFDLAYLRAVPPPEDP